MQINDRVEVINAAGFKKVARGDKGTVVKVHASQIGQGKLVSVKWDTPPRNKTSKIYMTRLRVITVPAAFSVGATVHLNSAFKSSPANTNGQILSVTRAKDKPTWLYRLRLANGKTVKVYEDKLNRGAYVAPAPAAAPAASNVLKFDRAALDAAIAAAKPGSVVLVVMPGAVAA